MLWRYTRCFTRITRRCYLPQNLSERTAAARRGTTTECQFPESDGTKNALSSFISRRGGAANEWNCWRIIKARLMSSFVRPAADTAACTESSSEDTLAVPMRAMSSRAPLFLSQKATSKASAATTLRSFPESHTTRHAPPAARADAPRINTWGRTWSCQTFLAFFPFPL